MHLRRATVIGAGVMGSAIAAHLANAGVPVWLLDIVPPEPASSDAGRTAGAGDRSRLARAGIERARRASPPAFMAPEHESLITPGNIEDDLACVGQSDWVIEAVVENLAAKQALLAKVEAQWRPGTIVSSNTSGLSIRGMAEGRSDPFRRRFLGTHFFNPPRYMRLVEVIPSAETAPEVVETAADLLGRVLGKGIVYAKDTPNFIGNRIGAFTSCLAIRLALEGGYTVEEVDALTGPLIGRPRTGTFRLSDLVGLDTSYHVRRNVYESLVADPERDVFNPPAPLRGMVERGWLGAKTGRGFYWRRGGETFVVDLETLEYRPSRPPALPGLEEVAALPDLGERLRALFRRDDRAAVFVRRLVGRTLAYAARVLPEISDDVVNVDRAMRWGFHWELGPFELWDALGAADAAARLASDGIAIPPTVQEVIRRGDGRFYRDAGADPEFFDPPAGTYRPVPALPGVLDLGRIARSGGVVKRGPGAVLLDLGDGVACVAVDAGGRGFGTETLGLAEAALDRLEQDFEALVLATEGRDFCPGPTLADLLAAAEAERWSEVEDALRRAQALAQRIRRSARPVVGAPHGRTVAAGAALCLACARRQAAAETSIGFVDIEAGLIPSAGGTVAIVRRAGARIPPDVAADVLPFVQWAFDGVVRAQTSQSALEARRLGYLDDADGITMDAARLVRDAKEAALSMVRLGYRPPPPARIRAGGERVRAALDETLYILRCGGRIRASDEAVGRRLAHVMAGGAVPEGTPVSEDYLLDLEREALLGLLGEAQTRARMRHLVETGRPLRN
jgi:3-hydroxyacyl-CoA dehydrogenase